MRTLQQQSTFGCSVILTAHLKTCPTHTAFSARPLIFSGSVSYNFSVRDLDPDKYEDIPTDSEMLKLKLKGIYVQKYIEPKQSAEAEQIREKLFHVFVSLSVPLVVHSEVTGKDVTYIGTQMLQFNEKMKQALLNLLKLRNRMGKCAAHFRLDFPASGSKFNKKTMRAACGDTRTITEESLVCFCLCPAIYRRARGSPLSAERLSNPALVAIRGHFADVGGF